ncbi:MAG: zf-TFIIB domain-containing protein [Deltaproteobacteria bacterium]|nr:zf-TFIIB domain-containing protein [Deltaproteobacteria bacterium]
MTDVSRTAVLPCPSCADASLREFQGRLVCDSCQGIMMTAETFASACAQLSGEDAPLEISKLEPTESACPRCARALSRCEVQAGATPLRGAFLRCDTDGLWCSNAVLVAAFARLGRKLHGAAPSSGAAGERPRPRATPVTTVNLYRDHRLPCPVCAASDLSFLGDRWTCDECHGLLVEEAALAAMVMELTEQPWDIPAIGGAVGPRRCPVCEGAMPRQLLEEVTVDRCATHGVWFDPQELETVLGHADDAVHPRGLVSWLKQLFT